MSTLPTLRAALAAALTSLALTATAGAQAPVPTQPSTGADYVASDNVEHVGMLRTVGDGVGATIIPEMKRMFVTSTQGLNVFDIADAENPKEIGSAIFNVQFENEEVPTNGKILGISSDTYCVVVGVPPAVGSAADGGCLAIYDVSNPAAIKLLGNVAGAGDHTQGCALDCTYMYGSTGTIVDLRDPANGKIVGNWVENSGVELKDGCHHAREIRPGILLGSCQPVVLFSIRAEDGASPLKPKVLATGANEDNRFIHSSRWPRGGADKFMLVGGERNAQAQCTDEVSAFMSWDATPVIDPFTGGFRTGSEFKMIDEIRPVNGTYADGNSPYNGLGCSVHWFMEQPAFKNGGLVALAEYENGTRFLQIGPDGKITEQGYFLPAGGSTSAPHWHPDGKVVYAIDYARGVDILRYTGDTYVPNDSGEVVPKQGATPGTGGKPVDAPACASAAGFRTTRAKGSGAGVDFLVDKRQDNPFGADIFQVSDGRSVVKERLIRRFTGLTGNFRWDGEDRKKRKLGSGHYFARLKMKVADGSTDTRRLTLRKRGSRFGAFSDFYQRTDCGVFRSFKLGSAAFGGRRNTPLTGAYRLSQIAKSVKVEAIAGSKVVRSFKGGSAKNRTYRFSFPAKLVKRGTPLKVRITVQQGTRRTVQTLVSSRV